MWPFREKYTEKKIKGNEIQLSGPTNSFEMKKKRVAERSKKVLSELEMKRKAQVNDFKKNISEAEGHFDEMKRMFDGGPFKK